MQNSAKAFERRLVPFADARRNIADGDLLLFQRRGLISVAGRGDHSHAAKAAWWEDDLFCVEVREWYGGRAVTLESQVEKFANRIDVYRANAHGRWPEYDRARATKFMRRLAGCDYGYAAVLAAAMLHLPIVLASGGDSGRSRAVPPGDNNMEVEHARAAGEVFRVYPVPYFKVRNPFLRRWAGLVLVSLAEAMQHTENRKEMEISTIFAGQVGQHIRRVYGTLVKVTLGDRATRQAET